MTAARHRAQGRGNPDVGIREFVCPLYQRRDARVKRMQHSLRGALSQRNQLHGRQHLVLRPTPTHRFAEPPRARCPSARSANANAVACDTPTTLFAAFAENSSVASSSSASTRSSAAAEMPILGAQLLGFATGDEECIPPQHALRVVLLPCGLQALRAPADRACARLAPAMPPIHSSARRFVGHPAGLDGVFESLRKMKRADGQRRARQVQQPQQLQRCVRVGRAAARAATAQPC